MPFRYLLRNWLRTTARRKAAEKVSEAVRRQRRTAEERAETAAQGERCHAGIVFALGIESGGLEVRLGELVTVRGHGFSVRCGLLKGRRVALAVSGAGRRNAERATQALIDGHRPELVISAGFAGGLADELSRGDILMADRLSDTSGGRLAIDLKVDAASLADLPGVHVGRLLTADRVIRRPQQKRALGREHSALAVDMETFAVAEVCRRREVRFLAVRVINDAVDDELPPDIEKLLAQKNLPRRLGAALGSIWRRPGSLKDFYRLRASALLASERLAKFIAGMVEQL